MNIKNYLLDKKHFFLFYLILIGFITIILYLDPQTTPTIGNIFYIHFVSFVLLILYVLVGYFRKKHYYDAMNHMLNVKDKNIIHTLPNPINHEHSLYHKLFQIVYKDQENQLYKLFEEKKDHADFVTSWVHEIKTPIAVSKLILENASLPIKETTLVSLEEELDKIDSQVEKALYYSKTGAFSKDYFIEDVFIESIVKSLLKKNAKTFIHKKIGIQLENLNNYVTTDQKWLQFIIDQILSNALKYTQPSGKIQIYMKKSNQEKKLFIKDNGMGIPSEDIGRIFDKGFTGHVGRVNHKSTGMGLYLAKRLARKLGHNISVTSIQQQYTEFCIHFPKLTDYHTL